MKKEKTKWQKKKLGDIFLIERGGSPRPIEKFLTHDEDGINWIKIGDTKNITKYIYKTEQKIKPSGLSKTRIVNNGDFILSNSMSFGRPYIMKTTGAIHDGWLVLREKLQEIDKDFFYYLLGSPIVFDQFDKLAAGSTVRNLNTKLVAGVEVLFPPISEQKRIVKILDVVFADIAKVKENTEKNLRNSKELFESYLQSVFENGIKSHPVKTLKEITSILGDGLHGTPKYTMEGEYYFINGNNLNEGKIIFKGNTKKVSLDQYIKYKKNLNDRTLLVSINGTLGNVAFYNKEKIILGKSACYFNLIEGIDKNYVKYFLYSPHFQKYALKEATGATIKNVSLKTMRDLKIPLPESNSQVKIVAKLDILSAETKKLEAIYSQKLADLEELKKSVLKKAFAGEL